MTPTDDTATRRLEGLANEIGDLAHGRDGEHRSAWEAQRVPRFGHGSRVPGWDDAVDLAKNPAEIPDPATTPVPAKLRAEIEAHMAKYPDRRSAALPVTLDGSKRDVSRQTVARTSRTTPHLLHTAPRLLHTARAFRVTVNDVLVAALARALSSWTGSERSFPRRRRRTSPTRRITRCSPACAATA